MITIWSVTDPDVLVQIIVGIAIGLNRVGFPGDGVPDFGETFQVVPFFARGENRGTALAEVDGIDLVGFCQIVVSGGLQVGRCAERSDNFPGARR